MHILLHLILNILCYHFAILPCCIHVVSSTPKTSTFVFYFKFASLSKIINVLFPSRYLMNWAVLMCGDTLTNICMWSGHTSASMIFASFGSHNFLSISPMSFRSFPYMIFLRYRQNAILFWITHFTIRKGHMKHNFPFSINPRTWFV